MSNSGAQMSVVNLHSVVSEEGAPKEAGGGLAAKAGIILVSLFPHPLDVQTKGYD